MSVLQFDRLRPSIAGRPQAAAGLHLNANDTAEMHGVALLAHGKVGQSQPRALAVSIQSPSPTSWRFVFDCLYNGRGRFSFRLPTLAGTLSLWANMGCADYG